MRAACLQLRVDLCQGKDNTARALQMAKLAIDRDAEILVFPEMFINGFCYDQAPDELPYPSLDPFITMTQEYNCIIIGSIMSGKYNLGFCLENNLVQFRPKAHPFDLEKQHFLGGDYISPVPTAFGRIGLEICYDLRFPEVARSLALLDADYLVTIAQFPSKRLSHWRILCQARAIENQLPHLACNWANAGGSMIVDSRGQVQAEAGPGEEIVLGKVDLAERDGFRQEISYLGDRRPEIY
jgi:predicted amidohydrolase